MPSLKRPLKRVNVLIVHGTPLVRFGLAALLRSSRQFQFCAEADEAAVARKLFVRHAPEIVLLGLRLRGGDGVELIKDFKKLNSAACTLVISARVDALSVQRAFRAGAQGYLATRDGTAEILRAMRSVLSGELYASGTVARSILKKLADGGMEAASAELKALSDRELEIFRRIGAGMGATRLAAELHVSVKTIETHRMRMRRKLGLRSAAELSHRAARWLIETSRHENSGQG